MKVLQCLLCRRARLVPSLGSCDMQVVERFDTRNTGQSYLVVSGKSRCPETLKSGSDTVSEGGVSSVIPSFASFASQFSHFCLSASQMVPFLPPCHAISCYLLMDIPDMSVVQALAVPTWESSSKLASAPRPNGKSGTLSFTSSFCSIKRADYCLQPKMHSDWLFEQCSVSSSLPYK